MVITIAAAIFVFGILVLVHELGHFAAAKFTGMRVDEFAIGFGPRLLSFTKGETVYSLRAVPLGGFNDIAGMEESNNDAGIRGYCEKPIISRMLVILAGSFMNFLLPIVLFFGIFLYAGVSTPSPEPVFGTVIAGKPAYEAGLQKGDRVLAVDGKEVNSWQDFVAAIKDSAGNTVSIKGSVDTIHPGFFESLWLAVQKTAAIIMMMLGALWKIVMELSGAELAGPLGVAQMAGEVAQLGMVPLLNFAAFLSLNLGIVNLFPIPALDGGHFAGLCVEAVRGKPMGPKALEYTQKFGIALLVLLMLLATKNDIIRIFTGG